jgi:hypothetical protein
MGTDDRVADLRVDDHAAPIEELRRIFELHGLLFGETPDEEWLDVDEQLALELRERLDALGYEDEDLERAFLDWAGTENLEERVKEPTASTPSSSRAQKVLGAAAGVRAVANQQLGKVEIAALLCLHQRRETSVLPRVRVGARFEEYLGVVHPPRSHGAVQRGRLRGELLVRRSSLQVGPAATRARTASAEPKNAA